MEAFEELVLRYERRIFAFISQSCRNGMDAAEITQETFVKAYQSEAVKQFIAEKFKGAYIAAW